MSSTTSTSTAISLHLANTRTGEYDVRLPLPKPLHCDPATGRITRKDPWVDITQVIGFAVDPDEFEVDVEWREWVESDPMNLDEVVDMFAVVSSSNGDMATLTVPVTSVTTDVPLTSPAAVFPCGPADGGAA